MSNQRFQPFKKKLKKKTSFKKGYQTPPKGAWEVRRIILKRKYTILKCKQRNNIFTIIM
jgi:hypothetical protein